MVKSRLVKVVQGGFSDIRLWPCYMVFSISIFFLMPVVGLYFSLLIAGTPFALFIKWLNDTQPYETYDSKAWNRDFDIALAKKLPIPDLANYKIIVSKKPKIKAEKAVLHKSPQQPKPQQKTLLHSAFSS